MNQKKLGIYSIVLGLIQFFLNIFLILVGTNLSTALQSLNIFDWFSISMFIESLFIGLLLIKLKPIKWRILKILAWISIILSVLFSIFLLFMLIFVLFTRGT
jgi:hypothetical protein